MVNEYARLPSSETVYDGMTGLAMPIGHGVVTCGLLPRTTCAEYDRAKGAVKEGTGPNGEVSHVEYDDHGRAYDTVRRMVVFATGHARAGHRCQERRQHSNEPGAMDPSTRVYLELGRRLDVHRARSCDRRAGGAEHGVGVRGNRQRLPCGALAEVPGGVPVHGQGRRRRARAGVLREEVLRACAGEVDQRGPAERACTGVGRVECVCLCGWESA